MDAPDPFPPADPLGEALHFLRMNGAYYCRSELTAPWGLTLPPMPGYLWFHVVTSGRIWLETEDEEQGWIQLGDLALVPHGDGHVLRSEPGAPAPGILDLEREPVSDRYEILRHGEGGAPTGLICGAVRFAHPAAGNLIEILPSDDPHRGVQLAQAGVDAEHAATDGLRGRRAPARRRGRDHAPRGHPRDPGDPGLDRERSGRADGAGWERSRTHRSAAPSRTSIATPLGNWTVASLAHELAMSRSAFAARFTELVGEPVMSYVARWRMHVAVPR